MRRQNTKSTQIRGGGRNGRHSAFRPGVQRELKQGKGRQGFRKTQGR